MRPQEPHSVQDFIKKTSGERRGDGAQSTLGKVRGHQVKQLVNNRVQKNPPRNKSLLQVVV